MKIAIIGAGYVGITTGACLANIGHDVIGLDIDEKRISNLNKGKMPIYEPGLSEMVSQNLKQGKLQFTTDAKKAIQGSDVIFIAVGTPAKPNGETDLTYVFSAAATIGRYQNGYKVIVDKSTVPVMTADKVKDVISSHQKKPIEFDLVSNPEFLREGEAINDFMVPDRIVIGVESEKAKQIMLNIYKSIERTGRPILFTDIKSAELIKYASNAMLATRISFMNSVALLCAKVGADIKLVGKGIGLDDRIGPRFLQAGIGYGGSCFPKDVKSLAHTMKEFGCDSSLLDAVEHINDNQKQLIISTLKSIFPTLMGKKIAIWGLSFKPKTDDMREAPSLVIIPKLVDAGAIVSAYDPQSIDIAKPLLPKINYAKNPIDAAKGADAILLLSEWDVFREFDKAKLKQIMRRPLIIDGRNIYDKDDLKKAGFQYIGVGR